MSQHTVNVRLVTRNDTAANWASINPILLAGEMAIESDTGLIKVGNGTSTWDALDYINDLNSVVANHYEGTAGAEESDLDVINRVLAAASATAEKDDTFIVKRVISGSKTSYTAYVYNGTAWSAMDGNYDASNVYFDSDLTATVAVGTIQIPSSGSTTVSAAGKSVKEVLSAILAEEKNPTVTQPSVSITFSNSGRKEVGTKIQAQYTATLNPGSYTYGPATGVTAKTWSVTNSVNGTSNTLTTSSGTFDEITVGDNTSLSITATATYNDGAMPKTNLGNDYTAGQIKAGSASTTSTAKITGYRNFFYGVVDNTDTITSDMIRGLNKGGAYNASQTFDVEVTGTTAKRIIVAYPADTTRGGLTKAIITTSMNADVTSEYVEQSNVLVEGANGYTAKAYTVFVYQPAKLSAQTHQITLA